MNICFHDSFSNCQNIDNHLYICGKDNCSRYKCPNTIYNSYGDRTSITIKSIIWAIINCFKKESKEKLEWNPRT